MTDNIKVGHVVLIHDDCPSVSWKMGVITKLHVGRDDFVRSVNLKTYSGHIWRPIAKLYPLGSLF